MVNYREIYMAKNYKGALTQKDHGSTNFKNESSIRTSSNTGGDRLISIILPVLNEEHNLEICTKEIQSILDLNTQFKFEVIFVDDGSTDNSPEIIRKLCREYSFVKAILFRRNFGQTAAMSAGVSEAKGELIVFMDSDLQNDPGDIPMLIQKIDEGYDIVSGWRKNREDRFLNRKLPSYFANKLASFISGVKLHDLGCSLKIYRSELIKEIKLYGEMHRFIPLYGKIFGSMVLSRTTPEPGLTCATVPDAEMVSDLPAPFSVTFKLKPYTGTLPIFSNPNEPSLLIIERSCTSLQ